MAAGLFSAALMESAPLGYYPINRFSHWITIPEFSATFSPTVIQGTGCGVAEDLETCLKTVDVAVLSPIVFPDPLSGYYGIPDTATYLSYIGQAIVGRNLSEFANHPAFLLPSRDPAWTAFNLAQIVSSDVLPKVYTDEFNRTYQPSTFTSALCKPPVTIEHPYGDPSAEYFKCHSGDIGTAHGELLYGAKTIRDELDILFEQLVVDYWVAYIWNNDPNLKAGYLKMMRIQWNGGLVDLNEETQCAALGFPLEYFEGSL
ncbi:hypothetical protein H072_4344 [Dactylellina haptotyla CBS 200.50]|uniref:Carboxylesterase type B domain-containing protein n=1 Tax=Dactylellina haptotyla (strain CBS 200.50) TaxID=1284197 RepID=S8AFU3_DACHA|nr:hypothetical protein H072_4344 [Dactylellina haptotyla CBS 200.50]